MYTIDLPKKIEYEEGKNANQGKIIIEPCYPGYGVTLGNSLRRVLLSSLPGSAPIGVKIKGINHEFDALPHLKEDILEFILNLKQLRLNVMSDEIIKLELEVHGKKEVKASDIKKNSQVEIINSDLVLGRITDMAGSIQAEIFVSQGMGYEMIENRENKNNEIGYIEMDSIFSPIISAGIKVENVRVGKMTDWDKLILDVMTDGTITPEKAFKEVVKILISQFSALDEETKTKKQEENNDEIQIEEEEKIIEEEQPEEKKEEKEEPKKKRGRPKKVES